MARTLRSLRVALRIRIAALADRVLWRGQSLSAALDIPAIAGEFDAAGVLFLDGAAFDRHLAALGGRVGAMPAHIGSRFAQRAARRMAARLGARYAGRLGVPAETLADAWYASIWSELCTLIPLRHLARHLARHAAGGAVVIPIEPGPRRYLTFWDPNGLEPFYLAAELQRRGTPVAFWLRQTTRGGTATIRLEPNLTWHAAYLGQRSSQRGSAAVVPAGLRGTEKLLRRIAGPILVASAFSTSTRFDLTVADRRARLPVVELILRQEPASVLATPEALLRPRDPARYDLGAWLCDLLGPPTAAAAGRAARLVAEHGLGEAHVCDHMFWESAIVAHAVREAGGRVVLWPHSSNAVHVGVRRAGEIDRIHCATQSAAEAWRARFPDVPCSVASDLILAPCQTPRPLDPSQPLTVVVIAGGHRLNRLPVLDNDGHAGSYRRLFRGLAECAPGIRFVCKAKPPWESIEWLQSLVGQAPILRETRQAPMAIDLPNLVYVSVSFGSTALLEGLSRGIPCMIVRDIAVEDYTAIGPDDFPVGSVEMILARLRECRDLAVLRAMTEAQLAWYARETHFPSSRENSPR